MTGISWRAFEVEDRKVVQCNYTTSTKTIPPGARAYLVRTNPGNGNDRIVVLVRSRGGRWIEKWESIRLLKNFRVKTLPPGHPQYGNDNLWSYEPEKTAEMLEMMKGLQKWE
jgi:hypothetical protein